jgi:hypothetical protein
MQSGTHVAITVSPSGSTQELKYDGVVKQITGAQTGHPLIWLDTHPHGINLKSIVTATPVISFAGARLAIADDPAKLDSIVTFTARVFNAQKREGEIALDRTVVTIRQASKKGFLNIYVYGELLKSDVPYQSYEIPAGQGQMVVSSRAGISMTDLKQAIEKSETMIIGDNRPLEKLDTVKATGIIDLAALNAYPQQFDALTDVLIAKLHLAQNRGWGRNAVFLLNGPSGLQERVMKRAEALYAGQNFIFSDEALIDKSYLAHKAFLTTPHSKAQFAAERYFFLEDMGEKDLPNLLPGIWGALTAARLNTLESSNPDFDTFRSTVQSILGITFSAQDIQNFSMALRGDRALAIRFALPPIVRSLDKWIQGARLAAQMAGQSA